MRPFTEDQRVPLSFQVTDSVSGQPISAAFLRISDSFNQSTFPPRALTSHDGRARLIGTFEASGERNAFRTMGSFSTQGRWLEISAANYQTARLQLTKVIMRRELEDPRTRRIQLTKGTTPANPCHDIAGIYAKLERCNLRTLIIEPDGRFAWSYRTRRRHIFEYGYLNRNNAETELLTILPLEHEGERESPCRLRTVAWGGQLFLSETDDLCLQRFCRAGLTAQAKVDWGEFDPGYRRSSDYEKPLWGKPRLPAQVWLKFLFDELTLRSNAGSLRRALESLLRRFASRDAVRP